ncbi:MAG TPA: cytochrome P450 [Mycobacteriales bacterium]
MTGLDHLDLADPKLYLDHDFHRLFGWLRQHDPVHWNPDGVEPAFWSVTRYADCETVQKDTTNFSSAATNVLGPHRWHGDEGSGRMLTVTDPPRHTELRQLVNRSFTARAVAPLEPYVRTVVGRSLDQAVETGECDFVDVMAMLPVATIAALLGVPEADWALLLRLTGTAFGSADQDYRTSASARATSAQAHAQLLLYCQDLMGQRERSPRDDIVTRLVDARRAGRLGEEEAMLFFDLLLLGGNETTRHGAVGALLALMEFPGQWRRLRADRRLLTTAVGEVLRWVSPSRHVLRRAVRDVRLHDQRVRAGQDVVVWHSSANRDERVFPDAHVFDVGRTFNPHLALGSGPHHCLGAALAKLELRVFLDELCDRVGSAEMIEPPAALSSTVINGFKHLRVRLRPT